MLVIILLLLLMSSCRVWYIAVNINRNRDLAWPSGTKHPLVHVSVNFFFFFFYYSESGQRIERYCFIDVEKIPQRRGSCITGSFYHWPTRVIHVPIIISLTNRKLLLSSVVPIIQYVYLITA